MLTQTFLRTISEIAQFSLVVPLLAMLFRFKRFTKLFWTLGILLIVAAIISYSSYVLYKNGANNMYLLHIYTVLEYALWSLFYYQLFESAMAKKINIGLLVVFVTFSILNSIYWQPLEMYNSYSRSVEGTFLLCMAIAWFYKVFVNGKIVRLEAHPIFWINAGVLVYFSGSFLLFISNNFLMELTRQEFFEAWALHGLFLIIHYLFISIGIWLIKHKKELR
ncbi:hypothetical protein KORDIASMS9_03290 [Kordia sp. SMS9]|uniref:hypothetical protein n=1 Tax=Kordia sp. SMS9 TaxID=2282170 RepID=UPI000E0DF88D|nr:hypothetical protein [Kordia sp. SMS9]AXG71035.1 hypothetical protein KORDIASMS9_03290 [Kordia sp. SMS9]